MLLTGQFVEHISTCFHFACTVCLVIITINIIVIKRNIVVLRNLFQVSSNLFFKLYNPTPNGGNIKRKKRIK